MQALVGEIVSYTPDEIHEQVKVKIMEKHRMALTRTFPFASPEESGKSSGKPFVAFGAVSYRGVAGA